MIDLKTLSIAAAASAALLSFSTGQVSADTAKAPLQFAQAGSSSPSGRDTNSGVPSGNPSAMPGSGSSPTGSGTARGSAQCEQISDPRARQDCIQRQNDMRSGGSGSGSGATGNNSMGSGPGITNRGSGSK